MKKHQTIVNVVDIVTWKTAEKMNKMDIFDKMYIVNKKDIIDKVDISDKMYILDIF